MNLTESIRHLMSEGKLEWTTTDDVTGAEEAALADGSKFALHNIMGTLSLMYVGKDGKGNVIYRTPVGVPMAFKKAKQEAEKFLGIKKDKKDDKKADKKEDEVEEELGPENEWGTDELTNKEKAVTPGQTNEGYSDTYSTADVKKAILKQFPGAKIEIEMYSGRPIFDITHDSIPSTPHGDKAFQMSNQDKYQGGKKIGKEWSCSFFKRSSESDSHIFGDGNSPEAAMLDLKNKLDIVESLEDACWSGYKAIGTKEKDGKTVPNCVPESTNNTIRDLVKQNAHLYRDAALALQDKEDDTHQRMADKDELLRLKANPPVELAKREYGSVERYKKMIQDKIDRLQKKEAISGAEQVTLKSTDKLEVKYGTLLVNGRQFEVSNPDESVDWPKSVDEDGKLVTWFKGRQSQANTWSAEDITGRFVDKEEAPEEKVEVSERYVKTVQLITKETDRSIVEAFLTKHSVAGRESNLLAINTEFKRFKKLHEAENILSNDKMEDLIDKIRLKISKVIDDEWHNTRIIHDWIEENPEKVSHYMSRKNWDALASIAADEIATNWEEDPKGNYGKYLDRYIRPAWNYTNR